MDVTHNSLVDRLRAVVSMARPVSIRDRAELKNALVAANLERLRIGAWILAAAIPVITLVDMKALGTLDQPATPQMWAAVGSVRSLLLLGTITFLLASRGRRASRAITPKDHLLETGFLTFCLLCAAVVAGLGQLVRPSIGAYLLAIFTASAFFHLDGWKTLISYAPAWTVLTGLLWQYQPDSLRWPDLVNGTLMTVLALVLSRVTYRGRLKDLHNTRLIERQQLELELANRQLTESNSMLRRLSYLDALTGVPNRRWFDEFLAREWSRATRERTPIALIMADLDHFKGLNDERGHQVGDSCLVQVAAAFRQAVLRPADFLARYGGDELAVVLPETDAEGARLVAERIQRAVNGLVMEFPDGSTASITVSLGVASLRPARKLLPDDLVAAADQALYQAKAAGRARYVCAG